MLGRHPPPGRRRTATASSSASSPRRRSAAAPTCRRTRACTRATPSSCCWRASSAPDVHPRALRRRSARYPGALADHLASPTTTCRARSAGSAATDASPELAKLLFALLVSLKGTTLIYQGEELGLPQADLAPRPAARSGRRPLLALFRRPRRLPHADALGRPAPNLGFTDRRALAAGRAASTPT